MEKYRLINKILDTLESQMQSITDYSGIMSEFDRGRIVAYSNIIYDIENLITGDTEND
jgi:hypothetical protein